MLWHKTANSPLNSLVSKCLDKVSTCVNKIDHSNIKYIPNLVKQEILDYFTRQSISVPVSFICKLLFGIKYVDLWTLSDSGNLRPVDVLALLSSLKSTSHSLIYLSFGGSWIFDPSAKCALKLLLKDTSFPNLRGLCVQQLTSDELVMILNKCSHLETLNISQPCINDIDLISIHPLLESTICPNLIELSIPSSIHCEGIIILMACFPTIKSLKVARFESVLDAMVQYPLTLLCTNARNTLMQLKNLIITHPLGAETISNLVVTCPSLEEICLEIQECMQLQDISMLPQLKRLELRNSPNLPASYLNSVAPLLQKIGPSLQTLSLEYFDLLDISHIATLCPNLTVFSAQWFIHFGHNNINLFNGKYVKNVSLLSNLRYLRLRPRPEHKIKSSALHFILDHSLNLQHCELYCCDFSEDDLKKTGKLYKLVHLRTLIIRHGDELSSPFISQLTMSLPKLEYLSCDQTYKIGKENENEE